MAAAPRSAFRDLSRAQLAVLVPELLLAGHLIDRSGLAHVLAELGPDGMTEVAVDEWRGASPVYTRRMQRALGFGGDDVVTLFKGLQFDIGAPPQFMDFRFAVRDRDHGEFHLAHCGALMDVEPMGEAYVRRMCHDVEDPTFDATALATNPRARIRPVHRPPRTPADRTPHCAWTVVIDDAHEPADEPEAARALSGTAAARYAASAIEQSDGEGRCDYRGPLLADVDFAQFSHSALVRIAEEVCLQGHLLTLSFRSAVATRTSAHREAEIVRRQFTGIAGLAAERLCAALALPSGLDGAARLLALHPAFNPTGYAGLSVDVRDGLLIRLDRRAPAVADGAWPALVTAANLDAVHEILRAADPTLRASVVTDDADALELRVTVGAEPSAESPDVRVARISTGASFVFADRGRSLPVIPALAAHTVLS